MSATILLGKDPNGVLIPVSVNNVGQLQSTGGAGGGEGGALPLVTSVPAEGAPGGAVYVVDGRVSTASRDKITADPATNAGGIAVRVVPDGLFSDRLNAIARASGAQPTSLALSVSQATDDVFDVQVATLPLPAGAARESGGNLAAIAASTARIPAQGQALAAGSLPVVLPAAQVGALAQETGGNLTAIASSVARIPTQGQALAAASMPVVLPTLQVSALAQETGNLATIATNTGRLPAQGQALAGGSLPVVLPVAQQAALAPLTTAAAPGAARLSDGTAFYKATTPADTQPISSLQLPAALAAGSLPVVLPTAQASALAQDRQTAVAPHAARLTDGTAFYKATTPADTQPVSATALPLPAGAATAAGVLDVRNRLPATIGQQLAAASMAVVLPALQAAALAQETTLQLLLARFMPTDALSHAPVAALAGVIKAAPGTLWSIYALSTLNSDLWLMTFDTTTVPSSGSAPLDVVQVPRSNNGQAFITANRMHATGIVWGASTTPVTFTPASGTPLLVRARYL